MISRNNIFGTIGEGYKVPMEQGVDIKLQVAKSMLTGLENYISDLEGKAAETLLGSPEDQYPTTANFNKNILIPSITVICFQLRSSLDHIASEIGNRGSSTRQELYFPVGETQNLLENEKSKKELYKSNPQFYDFVTSVHSSNGDIGYYLWLNGKILNTLKERDTNTIWEITVDLSGNNPLERDCSVKKERHYDGKLYSIESVMEIKEPYMKKKKHVMHLMHELYLAHIKMVAILFPQGYIAKRIAELGRQANV